MMRRFRRSPVSGVETPVTAEVTSPTLLLAPSSPPLMSRLNRSALRRCRTLFSRHLDLDCLIDADDYFRFAQEPLRYEIRTSVTTFLDSLEQTGNDLSFERFVEALRVNQRHLAAVLDETRNQLRTWQSCFFRRESYSNLMAGSDEQNDYMLSPFDDDDSVLTGEEIRRIISRHVVMTTSTSCGNNSAHARNGATGMIANRAVATHVESENSDSCDAQSDDNYPNDVTYLSTNSFIDCFSAVNRVDHKNRKWIKHGRGNEVKAVTSCDSVAAYFETDAVAEQVEGRVTTWSATLVRNLEFRRIDRDKLSPAMPTPPEGYRSVYIIANDNSEGGRKSESNKLPGGGYASVTRRSQSFAFGNVTDVDVVQSGFELKLENSFFRDDSASHPEQRTTPSIPPKPKVFETAGTGECSSLGRHSVPSRRKKTESGLSSLSKFGSPTQTIAEIPPPLPARVNLSTSRRASLPPPPPPPPPRGTQMSSPTSSGHVTRPLSSSTSTSSSPGFVPDQRAPDACVENGSAGITVADNANVENIGDDDDDIDELDRQISASSSLSQLNGARDDNEHVPPIAENKRTKQQPVEDDYEPISAVKSGVANGILKQSLMTSSAFAVSSSSGSLVEEVFGACNGIFQKSETKSTLANSQQVVAEIHRGPEIKNKPPQAHTPTSGNENEQQLDVFVPPSDHVISSPVSNGADNDVSRFNESIADFMQQSLNGEPRAGGGSGVGQHDWSPEPEVNTISTKPNSKPEIASPEKLQNGADWLDEDESIVYEDIDQYQTDDTADDAYLDPATSSSLSGRIRLLKAELLKQQRSSGNVAMCQSGGGSQTQPIRGVLRRSSTVGPASSVRAGNGNRLPSSTFAVPHSMRRVLACGSLVVVLESGRVQSPIFDGGSGSNSDGDNRLQSSNYRQNDSKITGEPTAKPCNDVISASSTTGIGNDETITSNEQAPPVNPLEEIQGTDVDKKSKATDSRRPEAQVALALDRDGIAYCIPRSELRCHGDPRGEPWYYPITLSLRQATLFISCERQEGCFLLYKPSSGIDSLGNKSSVRYILSVGRSDGQVLHYPVLGSVGSQGLYVKGDRHRRTFMTLAEMVDYFRRNRGRLATRLRRPLREARWPPIFDLVVGENDERKYEIGRDQLQLTGDGNGRVVEYGFVCIGKYKQNSSAREIQVAVKVLQRTPFIGGESSFDQQRRQLPSTPSAGTPSYSDSTWTTDDDDFVAEARLLSTLQHDNIIRLIGVSLARRPFYLVTELCQYGQLHRFLQDRRKRRQTATANQFSPDELFGEPGSFYLAICRQAAEAVAYLEQRQYVIHRNISAASFDVSSYTGDIDDVGFGVGRRRASARASRQPGGDCGIVVKLADFSRARSVVDDEYVGDADEKVFVKLAAPEVLTSGRYSTKSDVWSLGVLFWEVYSDGTLPYDYLNASETAVYVTNGGRLDRPAQCPAQLYHLALKCWNRKPRDRPSPTTVCNRFLHASATNAWSCTQTNNFAAPKTASADVALPKSQSMPPGGAATATQSLHNDRSPNRLRMSQSFAAPSSPSPFSVFPLPSAAAAAIRPPIDVARTMTSSSPTLPRHRNRNPIQTLTSYPESELTLTRASAGGNRPRTATPVPRRKFDCSLVEGNEGSNGTGNRNEADGDAQSKTPHVEPGQRQDLLSVPDNGRAGSRRSRSNEGLGKAPSRASVSSGESVFLQNSFLVNGHTTDVRDSMLESAGSTTPTDVVRVDMTTDLSAVDAGKVHSKNKAYKKLAYKLIRRPVPTGVQ